MGVRQTVATKQGSKICLIGGIILLLAAPIAAIGIWSKVSEARASANWPTVTGTVRDSSVKEVEPNMSYRAVVHYNYTVDGQIQLSDQISAGLADSSTSSAAEAIVARFPAGSKVTVHYDPADSTRSYLDTGGNYAALIAPVIIAALGLALLRLGRPRPR